MLSIFLHIEASLMKDDQTLINTSYLSHPTWFLSSNSSCMNDKVHKTISITCIIRKNQWDRSVKDRSLSQFQQFLKIGKSCNESFSEQDKNRPDCMACGQQLASRGSLQKHRFARHYGSSRARRGEGSWCPVKIVWNIVRAEILTRV